MRDRGLRQQGTVQLRARGTAPRKLCQAQGARRTWAAPPVTSLAVIVKALFVFPTVTGMHINKEVTFHSFKCNSHQTC